MSTSEIQSDPFSAEDEAFFHAGLELDAAPLSERPVILEVETLAAPPSRSAELEARRARFIRPVATTLAFLSLVTLVGLVRHALRSESVVLEPRAPGVVRSSATSEPVSGAAPARELAASGLGADVDAPVSVMLSSCERESTTEPLSSRDEVTAPAGGPALDEESRTASSLRRAAGAGKPKPSLHAVRPAAQQSHPARKVAPVTKAALLNAIRAS